MYWHIPSVLYTVERVIRLHAGSNPPASTMISEDKKIEAQRLYDEVGNIKTVAKTLHIAYVTLKKFIVFKERPKRQIKPIRDTSKYRRTIKTVTC